MVESVVQSHAEIVVDSVEKKPIRVLHVDDELGFLKVAKQCLELQGPFQVDTACSVEEALNKQKEKEYDAVVSDYQMPWKDGLEFLEELRQKGNVIPFIMFTGKGREEVAIKALNVGADQYLNKNGAPDAVYCELAHAINETVERRRTGEELRRFSTAVRESRDGIITGDLNGNITDVNDAVLRMYGSSDKGDLIGKNVLDLLVERDRTRALQDSMESMRTGQGKTVEYYALTKSGTEIPIEITTAFIRGEQGEPTGFVDIVRNTSERKRMEEDLRESEEKYRKQFEEALDAIFLADADTGIILDCNRAATELVGREKSGLIGKHQRILHPPEEINGDFSTSFKQHLKEKEGRVLETRVITKNGEIKDVAIKANVFRLEDKRLVQGTFRDNTERKKTEKAIQESQQEFEGLFMGNPEAAAYLDPDFRIRDINPRFEELFGYSLADVQGKPINDVVVPDDRRREGEVLDKEARKGYVYRNTVRRKKDGSLVPVSVSAAPITNESGVSGIVAMYKDISDLKNAEKKLEAMNEKLRVVGGLTRHDVRNKLSAITGNIYLNRKKLLDHPDVLEGFSDMQSACEQIVRIFEFAKDYERLGVEELALVDVKTTVDKAASSFSGLKGVRIVNECHGLTILADSLLERLFYNLIDNSLKYGDKLTQIRIRYEKSENQLKLVYEDDGIGIPKNAKAKLFTEGFTTGKGSGYGLYLIKRMMDVYGWTISETGMLGKGAQFSIDIPEAKPDRRQNYRLS